jgi:membrane fusion protein, multidrug efflux system
VKQGQELFLIDPRPYQAILDQAKAQLAHDQGVLAEAQMDLTRYQTLEKENSIAQQQAQDQVYVVQQDKGTVDLDQANVDTAELNLEFCHLSAPISGRAGTLLVDVGNLVGVASAQTTTSATTTSSAIGGQASTGSTMVTIQQMQPIYVSFNVPQIRLSEIQRNQTAAPLEVDAFSQDGKLLDKGKTHSHRQPGKHECWHGPDASYVCQCRQASMARRVRSRASCRIDAEERRDSAHESRHGRSQRFVRVRHCLRQ